MEKIVRKKIKMNTFKKYPKLNLLFFLQISIILLVGLAAYYFISNITDAFDAIESQLDIKIQANATPKELQESIKKQAGFHELKNEIFNSIYYLIIIAYITNQLLAVIKHKTNIENKRLDDLENQV